MRVIGGEWKGRRLAAPAGRATRPTSDRVREAVFDVLGTMALRGELAPPPDDEGAEEAGVGAHAYAGAPLAGLHVLDLFAGSGALGIEALSRGARSAVFVERAAPALTALRANLSALGALPDRARVAPTDALRFLRTDARAASLYTLVFVDAPYARYDEIAAGLAQRLNAVLAPGAVVVVESARGRGPELPLELHATKTYGDTQVTFFKGV
jgi:16S rRNA (guanine966-N2)-methyltransferase